ncbi:hypothetical protein, partial [Pseudovibrio sp. WM33]|uniref:hypothetical protein n=1 Tax=Pseudovibrio sp. WM33 TaxID=1735585 RepID=UPI0019D3BEDE
PLGRWFESGPGSHTFLFILPFFLNISSLHKTRARASIQKTRKMMGRKPCSREAKVQHYQVPLAEDIKSIWVELSSAQKRRRSILR